MPKVLCTLPNASDEISGVKFVSHAKGMLSEDISDDVAAAFLEVPGYELVGAKAAEDSEDAEKAALLARAEAVKLAVKQNWGVPRLKAEVEKAEAEAADAAAKADADAAAAAKTE